MGVKLGLSLFDWRHSDVFKFQY